ncbi:MAG: FIG00855465: hypothetical protein [uncultured Sulfurovum sp.]|uniref:Uncharacterized protein n=1 Tax=uncultured Sulfurovum sp. TaxID=269237 RepID=A0A6S6SW32_9BACT|nr:MAG: FIG00855465: hypothetical protein [uncultured Sulfurovum sp.]
MKPYISLIIPVYNVEQYLEKCLDSVVIQTLKNIEIITINDGSNDNSIKILEQYAKKDSRIKIIDQGNKGLSEARNSGIVNSEGEYLAFLDSDDYIDSIMLETMYNKAKNDKLDIVICGFSQVDTKGNILYQTVMKNEIFDNDYICSRMLSSKITSMACNKIFKKDLFIKNKLLYPKDLYHEDVAITYKLFIKSQKIGSVSENFYNWLQRKDSISKSITQKHIDDIFFIVRDTKRYLLQNNILDKNYLYYLRRYFHFTMGLFSRIEHSTLLDKEKTYLESIVRKNLLEDNILTESNIKMLLEYDNDLSKKCAKYYNEKFDKNLQIDSLDIINYKNRILELEKQVEELKKYKGSKKDMKKIIDKILPKKSNKRQVVKTILGNTIMPKLKKPTFTNKDKIELKQYHNMFQGERCFVIGNGPSLNKCDLSLLKDEYSFAVNGIFYKTREMGYRPNFYMVEDGHVVNDNIKEINKFDCEHRFFPYIYKNKIRKTKKTHFFNADLSFYNSKNPIAQFSTDFSEKAYAGQSVTMMQLQLAYYLGFTEVYLIGMDFSYDVPTSTEITGNTYESNEDDPNHFHPDYFGKGKKWHDPKLDRVLMNYEKCKEAFEEDGRKIYNATVGGKLELFERKDYDKLF